MTRLAHYRRLFDTTRAAGPGELPRLPNVNPVDMFVDYLTDSIEQLGALKVPIDVLAEYPDVVSILESVGQDGQRLTHGRRGLSVVLLDGQVEKYVGNTLVHDVDDDGKLVHSVGWLLTEEIEIDYWSTSSRDRDFGRDLLLGWLLEFIERCDLFQGELYSVNVVNYYNSQSQRPTGGQLPQVGALHLGIVKLEVKRVFSLTYAEASERERLLIEGVQVDMQLQQFKEFNLDTGTGTV
jgi:hypothetical protein